MSLAARFWEEEYRLVSPTTASMKKPSTTLKFPTLTCNQFRAAKGEQCEWELNNKSDSKIRIWDFPLTFP
jgi:hypothetical protein